MHVDARKQGRHAHSGEKDLEGVHAVAVELQEAGVEVHYRAEELGTGYEDDGLVAGPEGAKGTGPGGIWVLGSCRGERRDGGTWGEPPAVGRYRTHGAGPEGAGRCGPGSGREKVGRGLAPGYFLHWDGANDAAAAAAAAVVVV